MTVRSALLWGIGILVVIGVIGVTILAACLWTGRIPTSDLLAVEADVAAFGAFYLAALASVVALVAYAFSSGRPELEVSLKFPDSDENAPVLPYGPSPVPEGQLVPLDAQDVDLVARIRLRNSTKYSAKNPYVRLTLIGLTGLTAGSDWLAVQYERASGVREVVWEGTDRSVHDERDLPPLDFSDVRMLRDARRYAIEIHVGAEGFSTTMSVPIELLARGDWNEWLLCRNASIRRDLNLV